jgi:hypothetical protein
MKDVKKNVKLRLNSVKNDNSYEGGGEDYSDEDDDSDKEEEAAIPSSPIPTCVSASAGATGEIITKEVLGLIPTTWCRHSFGYPVKLESKKEDSSSSDDEN